jgi:hypothetical protein
MRDIHNSIRVLTAIPPKAVGTSGATNGSLSGVLDTKGYDSHEFVINYGVVGATGDSTTPVVLECATSGGTYTSVADTDLLGTEAAAAMPAAARVSGSTQNFSAKVGYRGTKRFLKIRLYGLGHATGIVSASLVSAKANREPVA